MKIFCEINLCFFICILQCIKPCILLQDDLEFKQKQREQQKALEAARAKAGQKGPMGMQQFFK